MNLTARFAPTNPAPPVISIRIVRLRRLGVGRDRCGLASAPPVKLLEDQALEDRGEGDASLEAVVHEIVKADRPDNTQCDRKGLRVFRGSGAVGFEEPLAPSHLAFTQCVSTTQKLRP